MENATLPRSFKAQPQVRIYADDASGCIVHIKLYNVTRCLPIHRHQRALRASTCILALVLFPY